MKFLEIPDSDYTFARFIVPLPIQYNFYYINVVFITKMPLNGPNIFNSNTYVFHRIKHLSHKNMKV